jgi:hypothetical protein
MILWVELYRLAIPLERNLVVFVIEGFVALAANNVIRSGGSGRDGS